MDLFRILVDVFYVYAGPPPICSLPQLAHPQVLLQLLMTVLRWVGRFDHVRQLPSVHQHTTGARLR